MLRLKNIKIENDKAEADFTPEVETQSGHIVVDLISKEIIHLQNVPGYEYMHPNHAKTALLEMAKTNDKRTERLVMWY